MCPIVRPIYLTPMVVQGGASVSLHNPSQGVQGNPRAVVPVVPVPSFVQGQHSRAFRPMPLTQRPLPNTLSSYLFPFLSRKMAQTAQTANSADEYNVAVSLTEMGLDSSGLSSDGSDASGPASSKSRLMGNVCRPPKRQGPFVITPPADGDHSYASLRILEEDAVSRNSSIDNEYDFGGGNADDDDDDQISEPSNYPSDWDPSGDEVDGDYPGYPPSKMLKLDSSEEQVAQISEGHCVQTDDQPSDADAINALLSMMSKKKLSASYNGEDRTSPRKLSSSCSKIHSLKSPRSSLGSAKCHKSLNAVSKPSLSSPQSSAVSSISGSKPASQAAGSKKAKAKPRTSVKPKASASKTAKSSGSTVSKSTGGVSMGTMSSRGDKSLSLEPTGAATAKFTRDSPLPSANKNDFETSPSAKRLSSSAKSSTVSSKTKASIIMTRREKATAVAAAKKEAKTAETVAKKCEIVKSSETAEKPKSAHSMRTRGKKLDFSRF